MGSLADLVRSLAARVLNRFMEVSLKTGEKGVTELSRNKMCESSSPTGHPRHSRIKLEC